MILEPEQIKELYALSSAPPEGATFDAECLLLAEKLTRILESPIAIIGLHAGRWRLVAAVGQVSPPRLFATALRRAKSRAFASRSAAVTVADAVWTRVTIWDRGDDRLLLMIGGDWTRSQELLDDTAARMGAALQQIVSPSRAHTNRRLRAALTLSRRLVRAAPADVPAIVAEVSACAVDAERASVALYAPEQGVLTVRATYGYPAALVRHLRVRPGTGIIGSVFRTGRAVMSGGTKLALERPRSRYRTGALMALPLKGYEGVLGVVSVADPRGRASFDRFDLRTLRALSSVASLAFDRVRADEKAVAQGQLAAADPLTGLFNRRHLHSRLEEEVERARRQTSPLALLMLDVDGLKQLNDRLGHAAGDRLLRTVAEILRRSVRVFDVCTRYAGDEFAIVMPGAALDSSRQVADRIRKDVAEFRPAFGPWADDVRVTVSIGIAAFTGATADELFGRADQALYTAKRQGKNCVAIG